MIKKLVITTMILFTITTSYAVSVGDSYGGGTVFCVSDTLEGVKQCKTIGSGNYGLIMTNKDQANIDSPNNGVKWSNENSVTNAQFDNDGAVNTQIIINANPNDNTGNNAAYLCCNYRDTENHTDWYLPSKDELNKIYIYAQANNLIGKNCAGSKADGIQCLVGGWLNQDILAYWSSTYTKYADNDNDHGAWSQYFRDGSQTNGNYKSFGFGVRAIRVFNLSDLQSLTPLVLEQNKGADAAVKKTAAAVLKSIDITPKNTTSNFNLVKDGGSQQFVAVAMYSDGATKDLTALVVWQSSNERVAKIEDQTKPGLITAAKEGTAEITVVFKDGDKEIVSLPKTIEVINAELEAIEVLPENSNVIVGETKQVTAMGVYNGGSKKSITTGLCFGSSDRRLATISKSGMITALKKGTVTITVVSEEGGTGQTAVNVISLQSIEVIGKLDEVNDGESQQFIATGTYSDGTTKDITKLAEWQSSNESVAKIDTKTGVVTPLIKGTTKVTASLAGVISKDQALEVTDVSESQDLHLLRSIAENTNTKAEILLKIALNNIADAAILKLVLKHPNAANNRDILQAVMKHHAVDIDISRTVVQAQLRQQDEQTNSFISLLRQFGTNRQ